MRKQIITRGIPGSGKSTEIIRLGLEGFLLSSDKIRMMFSGLEMTPSGKMSIAQNDRINQRAWNMMRELTDERMKRGETLVIDATFASASEMRPFLNAANTHRYKTVILDFTEVPIEKALAQNMLRQEWAQVPEQVIRGMWEKTQRSAWPADIPRITFKPDGSHTTQIENFLKVPVLNLNNYKRIVHIGDIQGCATALKRLVAELGEIQPDDFWIFVGDALDRGIENGEAFLWLLENVIGKENVRFLWGNHEDHIQKEATGQDRVSDEFENFTLPQLKKIGITKENMNEFMQGVDEVVLYSWHGKQVMVNHAGLANVPKQPWMISTHQWCHGTGYYEHHVDADFDNIAPQGWTQVHGHRNSRHLPIQASARSFNLEDGVEFGGNLCAVILDENGWRTHKTHNPVFKPLRERKIMKNEIIPYWMGEGYKESDRFMPLELKKLMDEHAGVYEQASARYPHVKSLNFSKDVFFDASWDRVVVKARGLFINTQTLEIVARGYDKFFNEGEVEQTSDEWLEQNLSFPLTGYLKENGFLGNLGYDSETNQLFVSSKSNPDSPFADIFAELLEKNLSVEKREELKRWLRDTESCMPFEVIDPVKDPHIVSYEGPKLILLDVLHRNSEFTRLPYNELQKVAKHFGFECKEKQLFFKKWQDYKGWLTAFKLSTDKKTEGYVFEDSKQFQFKVKSPFYSHWKGMRSMKDYIVRSRVKAETNLDREIRQAKGKPEKITMVRDQAAIQRAQEEVSTRQRLNHQLTVRGHEFLSEQAHSFRDWCLLQSNETLKKPIVELRDLYSAAQTNENTSDENKSVGFK